MPSVRVKKGYSPLLEYPGATTTPASPARQRAWTVSDPFTSPHIGGTRPRTYSQDEERDVGMRMRTFEDTGRPSLRRGSISKVSSHIESTSTGRPFSSAPRRDSRAYRGVNLPQLFEPGGRQPSVIPQDVPEGDVVSFEGPHTSVTIPADGEMGRVGSALSTRGSSVHDDDPFNDDHHSDDVVEHLDVIDPQVATVATLTNAANAIVIPPMSFYSRKPVIVLPQQRRHRSASVATTKGSTAPTEREHHEDNLDRHVEDCLNKPDKFRRVMRGVWSFLKTPLGIITAIYGFNVILWGAGIVFFLGKLINVHNSNTQGFWVELCQQIETGLFSLPSIGLIPCRILDTYRICKIWHYKHKTAKLRGEAGLPDLYDADDLPDPVYDKNYVHVLSEEEQIDLHYHQHMFMESQTWYRPHGTTTHRAFPIHYALLICALNDWNSIFQCMLSACMWSMDRFERPAWTTATTLPAAFVCGILAGFYTWWGGRKTKRTEEVTKRMRMALAMEHPEPSGSGTPPTARAPSETTVTTPSPKIPHEHDYAIQEKDTDPRHSSHTVHIEDEMTVPPAEEVHGGMRRKRQ